MEQLTYDQTLQYIKSNTRKFEPEHWEKLQGLRLEAELHIHHMKKAKREAGSKYTVEASRELQYEKNTASAIYGLLALGNNRFHDNHDAGLLAKNMCHLSNFLIRIPQVPLVLCQDYPIKPNHYPATVAVPNLQGFDGLVSEVKPRV